MRQLGRIAALLLLFGAPATALAQAAEGLDATDGGDQVEATSEELAARVSALETAVQKLEQQPAERSAERAQRAARFEQLIDATRSVEHTLALGQADVDSALASLREGYASAAAAAADSASRQEEVRARAATGALDSAIEAVNNADLYSARLALDVAVLTLTQARSSALAD